MNEHRDSVQAYLQNGDVQQRIQRDILRARNEATVTIKQAAELFKFTENQLRDWEDRGLLTPERPQHETGAKGRRLYGPAEIVKLAIIRELRDAKYSPSEIPANIDQIWAVIENDRQTHLSMPVIDKQVSSAEVSSPHHILPIDRFVEEAHSQLFDRFFTAHVLYLVLSLICEDIPDTVAGLILPQQQPSTFLHIKNPKDLQQLGKCLVGWWGETRSFYTFLTQIPMFDVPSDYRVESLHSLKKECLQEESINAWIIIQRKAKQINISKHAIETIQRLLKPIYDNMSNWQTAFGYGARYSLEPAANFLSSHSPDDNLLKRLANMIVQLGGQTTQGENKWSFCSILTANTSLLPVRQRGLVARVQSDQSPHESGVTVLPEKYADSPSLRALQDARIVYRAHLSEADTTIAYKEFEKSVRSVIAVPVGGEYDIPIAVLYVASDKPHAFSLSDQRLLRMISKLIEYLMMTYDVRQKITENMRATIKRPEIFDRSFEDFPTESDFFQRMDDLLVNLQREPGEGVVSIIAVEIDKQSERASKYGDHLTRNLSHEIGIQLQKRLRTQFLPETWELYHIYSDRFYILLKGVSLETAGEKADRIRQALKGSYELGAFSSPRDQSMPSSVQIVPDVTVRLGVTCYSFNKLREVLTRYPTEYAIDEVRSSVLIYWLNKALQDGKGGDVTMIWKQDIRDFIPLLPFSSLESE